MIKLSKQKSPVNFTGRGARKAGRKDGRLGIPALEQQEHPPFEMQLVNVGKEMIERIGNALSDGKEKLRGLCQAMSAKYQVTLVEKKKTEEEKNFWTRQREQAERKLREFLGEIRLSHGFYVFALAFLSLVEIPTNVIVFTILGESLVLTVIMAGGLAFSIPFGGHLLGMFLRHQPYRPKLLLENPGLTMAGLSAVTFSLICLSVMRGGLFKIGESGITEMNMSPVVSVTTFLAINLLLFVIATLASYSHHYCDYLKAADELKVAKKNEKKANKKLSKILKGLAKIRKRYTHLTSKNKSLCDRMRQEAYEVWAGCLVLVQVYRMANLRQRKDGGMPEVFKKEPRIDMPEILVRQDEDWPELKE